MGVDQNIGENMERMGNRRGSGGRHEKKRDACRPSETL